jgi:DNA-binding NarL/FixJ family response regulator
VKPVQVAIADDSAVIRERLMQKLAQIEGIRMAWQAQDAAEAIAAFQQHRPEVAILDIQMPAGSGIEVLAHIKKESPLTTVIILTNYPLPLFRKRCLKAGADYFFDKSTEFEKVIEVLRSKARQTCSQPHFHF